ncbi:MAG: helix-turn-helix domain-containing protein [Clostridia bacterium]|nr:helix-turn-helix domain-containing protein [Clostridia bacterium]
MRIREERERNGIAQKDLAKMLNVSSAALSQWETGKRDPSPDMILKIADILEVTVDALYGRAAPAAVRIPVLGRVQAGIPLDAIEEVLDWEEIPAELARRGEYFGLKVRGDSMEPRICDGDVVIVRRQPCADTGDVAIVLVNGNDATIKKIKYQSDGVMLIPLNASYEPIFYSKEETEKLPVEVIGKVVELRGKL